MALGFIYADAATGEATVALEDGLLTTRVNSQDIGDGLNAAGLYVGCGIELGLAAIAPSVASK